METRGADGGSSAVEIRILGPVEVAGPGGQLSLGPQQAVLLCALLIEAGRVVPRHRLIELLWGESPGDGALTTLRSHVWRLRRALETAAGQQVGEMLGSTGRGAAAGYRLRVKPEHLDATAFERAVPQARQALERDDPDAAAKLLRDGLSLWRGPALADVTDRPFVLAEAGRLESLRSEAERLIFRAEMAQGRHAEVAGRLAVAVAGQPDDEELRELLALCQYRMGAVAEAVATCRDGIARATATGLDSPRLQRLQQRILRHDPGLAGTPARRPPPTRLPPDVAGFTGRGRQIALLEAALAQPAPIHVITGPPGVGKTALAVHVAHQVREAFPDGQLYASLRDDRYVPRPPDQVLGDLLTALDVPGAELPDGQCARSGLLRQLCEGRWLLLVLDDAASEQQVRSLLPGSPGCAVLITSRTRLTGLEDARVHDLETLTPDQSVGLMAGVLGTERIAADPEAANRLAAQAGHLPLAVRVLAAKLAARPHWTLGLMADRLTDERRRLDELAFHDVAVRASFEVSYRDMSDVLRHAFALLARLAVPDFGGWVLAPLLAVTLAEADEIMARLAEAHLVEVGHADRCGRHRYRLHDLLRLFGGEQAVPGAAAALTRVADTALGLAQRAEQRLGTSFLGAVTSQTASGSLTVAEVRDLTADPLVFFDAERGFLSALVDQVTGAGNAHVGCALAAALVPYFDVRSLFDDWQRTHQVALAAAAQAGDRRAEAVLLRNFGELDTVRDDYPRAVQHFTVAARRFAALGERLGEAAALSGLGVLHRLRGCYPDALACLEQSATLCRRTGNPRGEVYAMHGIGIVRLELDELPVARELISEALALANRIGYRAGIEQELRGLGLVSQAAGDVDEAAAYFEQSGRLADQMGDRLGAALATLWLGHLAVLRDDTHVATTLLCSALAAFRALYNRFDEALALHELAVLALHQNDPERARGWLAGSLRLWDVLGSPYRHARSLDVQAEICARLGDAAGSRTAADRAAGLRRRLRRAEAATSRAAAVPAAGGPAAVDRAAALAEARPTGSRARGVSGGAARA